MQRLVSLQAPASMAAFLFSCFLMLACLAWAGEPSAIDAESATAQFGRPGAFLAGPLFYWFGPGSYVLALGALVGSALWFRRVAVSDVWLRVVGVFLTASVISTISAELAGPERRLDGNSGLVGVAASMYVLGQFGALTTVLVLAGALGVGLILAVDNVMISAAFAFREIRRLGLRAGIDSFRGSLSGFANPYEPQAATNGGGTALAVGGDDRGVAVAEPGTLDARFDPAGRFDPDADFSAGGLSDPSDTICGDTAVGAQALGDSGDGELERKMWEQAVEEAATVAPGEDTEFHITADGAIEILVPTGPRPQPVALAEPSAPDAAPFDPTTIGDSSDAVAKAPTTEAADAVAGQEAQADAIAANIDAAAGEFATEATDAADDGEAEDSPRRRRLGLRELLPSGDSFVGLTEPAVAEAALPTQTESSPTEMIAPETSQAAEPADEAARDDWSQADWSQSFSGVPAAQNEPSGEAASAGEPAQAADFTEFDVAAAQTASAEEAQASVSAASETFDAEGPKAITFGDGAFGAAPEASEATSEASTVADVSAAEPTAQAATTQTWDSADEWNANIPDTSSPAAFDAIPEPPAATSDEALSQPSPAAEWSASGEFDAGAADADAEPPVESAGDYKLPDFTLLDGVTYRDSSEVEIYVRDQAEILERALSDFGVSASVVAVETGPVVTMFELDPAPGVKINRFTALENDLARALKAPSVRVVAPLPNKDTVGLEVPNAVRDMVRLKELMEAAPESAAKMHIPLYLGKDVAGKPLAADMTGMPHLLIAGTTGSGKSVCINAIIMSILMTRRPDEVKMILIDPKIVEMAPYKDLPHLMCPVVNDMAKAQAVLEWAVAQMEERYSLLADAGVRNIAGYNRLTDEERVARFAPSNEEETARIPKRLPYVVMIIDELADLMMTSGKQVETLVTRLAQKSRAVGIHMILATQRPSVDVITGLIKANMPARISFRVAGKVDSRTILDQKGADALLGQGDMLYMVPGTSKLLRAQGTYISDEEVNRVVGTLTGSQQFAPELEQTTTADAPSGGRDELFDSACEIVVSSARGSVSLLQRRLNIGYSRAARLIDQMAEAGIVGEYRGSAARDVMMTAAEWKDLKKARDEAEKA